MATALITGVNGQDGSYLAELLMGHGYRVVGWVPDNIPVTYENIQHILQKLILVRGSLGDQSGMVDLIEEYRPDEVYNFASPSSPAASWGSPVDVGDAAGLGVARWLEAIRLVHPAARFYQASSSEIFGNPVEVPQKETTPFHPRNPYGISKLFAHWMVNNYRARYNMYAVAGILYNHESPRRGMHFVTRKITYEAARIKLGLAQELRLGNLEACRDWGYAGDYVEAIWAMMHQEMPDDFVIGTGKIHSVKQFCEAAFGHLDLDYRDYVVQDPQFYRPVEERQLVADPRKSNHQMGWYPKTSFEELVRIMVEADLIRLQKLL
jgi:GDPmannose 4,6-dehydratase